MKCFKLDDSGDIVFQNNDVELIYGNDLLVQKIRQGVFTNRGEWWLDPTEGIKRRDILKKKPNPARIRDQIKQVVKKIDNTLSITDFEFQNIGRHMTISFMINGMPVTLEE